MKLTIRARHLDLTPELRDQMRRRLHFALSRLATSIRTVDVTIVDINGPRGGVDQQCRIRVRGPSLPEIVVEQLGADVLSAISSAADRAGRAVARSLARRRSFGPTLAS